MPYAILRCVSEWGNFQCFYCAIWLLGFQALHQKILDNSFVIVKCKDLVWKKQDSEKFYIEHAGER